MPNPLPVPDQCSPQGTLVFGESGHVWYPQSPEDDYPNNRYLLGTRCSVAQGSEALPAAGSAQLTAARCSLQCKSLAMLTGQGSVARRKQNPFVTQILSEPSSQKGCGWPEICRALCGAAVSVSAHTKRLSALARGTEMRSAGLVVPLAQHKAVATDHSPPSAEQIHSTLLLLITLFSGDDNMIIDFF